MKNKIIFKTLMLKGEAGSTIVSMEKTGHVGTADIYTITFNDGSTTEISLENMSAITSVEKTSSTDTEDIYTITCADGSTQTFSVLNHNADIAAMSEDIDTIDARVDNFINSVVPNTVETLWTGSISQKNDSATLSKAVSNFDYIDLYLLGSSDSKYIRVPATQTAVQIQQQNMSDDASSNFLRLWEMGVTISGTTVSINKVIAWAWDDPDNSNPTATADAQNAIPITRIDGVKIASNTPAELADVRVGGNGVTYVSAGDAVRGQYADLNYLKNFTVNYEFIPVIAGSYNGFTVSRNPDGSIRIKGTPSEAMNRTIGTIIPKIGKTYLFESNASQTLANTYLYIKGVNGTTTWYETGYTFTCTTADTLYLYLTSASSETEIDFTVRPIIIEQPAMSSEYLNNKIDFTDNRIDEIIAYKKTYTPDDLGLEFKNYDVSSTTEISASNSRLTTVEKIDTRFLQSLSITALSGYRYYVVVYDDKDDIAPAFTLDDWNIAKNRHYYLMFPYCRIVLAKTSGNISPSDVSNFTIVFSESFSDYTEKEVSLMLEKYISKDIFPFSFGLLYGDTTSKYAYEPYQGSGTLATSDVWISDLYKCAAGDSIDLIAFQETSRPMLQTFASDGSINYTVLGAGTTIPNKITYTFTDSDKCFRVATRRTQFRSTYIKYNSAFNKTKYVPDYAKAEYENILSALQEKQLLGNPVVFGFNTDQHVSAKYEPTGSVVIGLRTMNMLSKAIPFDFICLGGDAPSYGSTTVVDVLNDVNHVNEQLVGSACPVISIVGNHDAKDNNANVTNAEIYNVTFKRSVNARLFDQFGSVACNAYIDSAMHSIRYIFVDSIPRTGYALADVNAFLTTALSTLPSGYNALIISHRALNTSLSTTPFGDSIDCAAVLETYATKIIACISGHSHQDGSDTINGILYICTTTSGLDGLASGDTRLNDLGTANETAYDVFVIDQANNTIYAIRYGYGSDRNWTYTLN